MPRGIGAAGSGRICGGWGCSWRSGSRPSGAGAVLRATRARFRALERDLTEDRVAGRKGYRRLARRLDAVDKQINRLWLALVIGWLSGGTPDLVSLAWQAMGH